ncbi:MAG: hypothetical protein WB800_16180 [Streptosporangiaceae bacterium]
MEEAEAGPIRDRLLSAFPVGTFARVDVLGYGDDPAVEPGGVAVRAFVDRAGRPEENWDSRETLAAFADTHSVGVAKLHDGLLGSIAWVEFVPDTPQRRAMPYDHTQGGSRYLGSQRDALEGTAGGAPVRVWLGPAELAAVDALIASGIATSRADVIRWAVSRARENRVTYDRT